ncbi:MAG: GDP-L-fucose synthase family protein, partial [Marinilabiliaceae bacterium]
MNTSSRIYVAGHKGLVGSAITRELKAQGYNNLLLRSRSELDLLDANAVNTFFEKEGPEYVFLAAARVGGIMANNTYRADFLYENLQIQNHVIHAAWRYGVKKLLFLGSSCIYPRECPQPMKEEHLLTGPLEYTNEPYAIAKIAGMKMCESYNLQYNTDFISVMPTNLYGPNDNYNLYGSHVLPALIRKMHLARLLSEKDFESIRNDFRKSPVEGIDPEMTDENLERKLRDFGIVNQDGDVKLLLWGTGKPRREFLHSDDLARACVYIMN